MPGLGVRSRAEMLGMRRSEPCDRRGCISGCRVVTSSVEGSGHLQVGRGPSVKQELTCGGLPPSGGREGLEGRAGGSLRFVCGKHQCHCCDPDRWEGRRGLGEDPGRGQSPGRSDTQSTPV